MEMAAARTASCLRLCSPLIAALLFLRSASEMEEDYADAMDCAT